MAGRALLEVLKFLNIKELLTAVPITWKQLVHSDEILLSLLDDSEEDEADSSLSLYQRVIKLAMRTVNFLLHLSKGEMLVWDLTHPALDSTVFRHPAFLSSSVYVLISPSKALITGGDGQTTLCIQVALRSGEVTTLPSLLQRHA